MWKKSSLEKLAIVPLIWSLDFIDFYFPKIPGRVTWCQVKDFTIIWLKLSVSSPIMTTKTFKRKVSKFGWVQYWYGSWPWTKSFSCYSLPSLKRWISIFRSSKMNFLRWKVSDFLWIIKINSRSTIFVEPLLPVLELMCLKIFRNLLFIICNLSIV